MKDHKAERRARTAAEQCMGALSNSLEGYPYAMTFDKARMIMRLIEQVNAYYKAFLDPQEGHMPLRTYTIELKVLFDDESRNDMALKLVRRAAKTLLTQASLITDGRQPKVHIHSEDVIEGIDPNLPLNEEGAE